MACENQKLFKFYANNNMKNSNDIVMFMSAIKFMLIMRECNNDLRWIVCRSKCILALRWQWANQHN